MERKVYPSDITRDQFEVIRPMLEGARHKTAPRKVDLYDVFCAILYLLRYLDDPEVEIDTNSLVRL